MKFFILTDLEGAVGVERFTQTRVKGVTDEKLPGMKQLAREVNACIEGIRDAEPDAVVDVWDGHGPGGLLEDDIIGGRYLREGRPYMRLDGYDGLLFVGQHAMAGTVFAPLCHTYSSLHIAYYKLNGVYIGEFGARALLAGYQGVPTVYLSGDDKAASEARMFVPEIETTVVKKGTGLESAVHLDPEAACAMIRRDSARAVQRRKDIPPFTGIKPPFTFEIRHYHPLSDDQYAGCARIDDRTVAAEADSIMQFGFI